MKTLALVTLLASTATAELSLAELELAGKVNQAKTGGSGTGTSNPCGCEERRVMVDFNDLEVGDYTNTLVSGKLTVTVEPNNGNTEYYAPGKQVRIFDSSDPQPDFDLGSPNNSCGGPGRGNNGVKGADDENCQELGNLLILQRIQKNRPDSSDGGATFKFKIDDSVQWRLGSIGFLNSRGRIDITTTNKFDGSQSASYFNGKGANAYSSVIMANDIRYYSDITIDFPMEASIAWMLFCEPMTATQRLRRRTNEVGDA